MIRVAVYLVFVGMLMLCAAQTNCGIGAECDSCQHKKQLSVCNGDNRCAKVTVCCKTCDSYFISGHRIINGKIWPYCTCMSDRISGTCWKGDQCNNCTGSGSINGVPICCKDCKARGLSISPSTCNCL